MPEPLYRLLTAQDFQSFSVCRAEMLSFFQKSDPLTAEELRERFDADGPGGAGRFMVLGAFESEEMLGFAAFSTVYSVEHGAESIVLSDLYIRGDRRRAGIGRSLMAYLAGLCLEHGWTRVEWRVDRLDFDARTFHDMLNPDGFKLDQLSYRIEGEEIAALAAKANL